MKERIKAIMDAENLTPSLFADKLKIGRAVISHILNGRNNPSLDVVTRILETLDYIDADWLLSGKGSMRREGNTPPIVKSQHTHEQPRVVATDLFNTKVEQTVEEIIKPHSMTSIAPAEDNNPQNSLPHSSLVAQVIPSDKQISKIIIYYTDNSFQAFNPNNSPL